MKPDPKRPEILGQKYLTVRNQHRGIAAPLPGQQLAVLRRTQRHPVRTIHAMRTADPPAHARTAIKKVTTTEIKMLDNGDRCLGVGA